MWRLLDLGAVSGYVMTNLYEVVARQISKGESPNTFILCHPEAPFVNIGYHQLMEKSVDVERARQLGYALVRRTIGGGTILDGPWEQDYFAVVDRNSPHCPPTIPGFYGKFLQIPVEALKRLGLEAKIRPPNDILVNERKISGNGAITIERANVLAGDLLLDAPTKLMAEVIKTPSEKFQDKVASTMGEWITSIRREAGEVGREAVKEALVEGFKEALGVELEPGVLSQEEREHLEALVEERSSHQWIFSKDEEVLLKVEQASTGTKIRGGVVVSEASYKAGKLIQVLLVSHEDVIRDISISGDFFTYPLVGGVEGLERALVGVPLEEGVLEERVEEAFRELGVQIYGAQPKDIAKAILLARHSSD